MELGARIRQERLAKGLSQRQLCGNVITRNMLSQIENGTAKPSMDTLVYLATQLEKPVGYFLEGRTEASVEQQRIVQAREAFATGQWELLGQLLAGAGKPDPVWDPEYWLLQGLWSLHQAEQAIRTNRRQYARQLLEMAEQAEKQTVYGPTLRHRRMLLQAKVDPEAPLPPEDESLLLRAQRALKAEAYCKCEVLLESCEEKKDLWWQLYGEAALRQGQYEKAAGAFHKVETPALYGKLEECYRQLGNYKKAYEYACKQRER